MSKNEQLDFLKRLSKGLAEQFGKNCEVVIHDLTSNYESTIVAIENGHITGRKIGDGASEIIIRALRVNGDAEDRYNYFTRTNDGKELKSSTFFFKDENKKPIATLSINYDLSDLKLAENIIKEVSYIDNSPAAFKPETIPNNVNDLLDQLIDEAYQLVGKPVSIMTRDDKVRAVRYLEQRGALLITKAGDRISSFFDISKYTLYGYLSPDEKNK